MRILTTIIWIAMHLALHPVLGLSQTYKLYPTQNNHNHILLNTATGEVLQIQDDGLSWTLCEPIEPTCTNEERFCLYETQNMWNFILLDTYTGKNWQVQFSVDGDNYRFVMPINSQSFANTSVNTKWTNRFQMFATQNRWNFVLLDSYNGRLWQVQYSTQDFDELMCLPINEKALVEGSNTSVFSVQPLTSMYQYYLVNDKTGDIWKFQWTTQGDNYRWIERIR